MAYRMQDFECKDCKNITEALLDLNKPEEEKELKCEHCGSDKLSRVITVGNGKGEHISWSKWRV